MALSTGTYIEVLPKWSIYNQIMVSFTGSVQNLQWCVELSGYAADDTYRQGKQAKNKNKRSKDLGALLDSCSWDDFGNFLQTCIKNSLQQTKSIEIWVNSHTVPHYACIKLRSYSTP